MHVSLVPKLMRISTLMRHKSDIKCEIFSAYTLPPYSNVCMMLTFVAVHLCVFDDMCCCTDFIMVSPLAVCLNGGNGYLVA